MESGIKFDDVRIIQALLQIGGFSRYQYRCIFVLSLSIWQFAILIAGLPEFIAIPSIKCTKKSILSDCTQTDICSSNSKFIFDYTNFRSIVYE